MAARPRRMATGALDLEVHHARSVRRRSPGELLPVGRGGSGGPEYLVGCAVGEDEAAVEGEGGGNRPSACSFGWLLVAGADLF
jgi:hypothetical protein